jgi:hypothetical protein
MTTTGAPRRARPRSLFAFPLAAMAVAVAGALGPPGAQAKPHPDHRPRYEVTADLDGRKAPERGATVKEDFLRDGSRVRVICQTAGDRVYGSRIWDLVPRGRLTLFVPDRFIRTGTAGFAPEIGRCTADDLERVTVPPQPHPPNRP